MSWMELYFIGSTLALFWLFWGAIKEKNSENILRSLLIIVLLQIIQASIFTFGVVPTTTTTIAAPSGTYTIDENDNAGILTTLSDLHTLLFLFAGLILGINLLRSFIPDQGLTLQGGR
jgi:hypothetical protein